MTFTDLTGALRQHRWLAITVFAIIAVAGTAAALLPAERYESSAALLVEPRSQQTLTFGAAEAIQYMLPPVRTTISSDSFDDSVRARLPSSLSDAPFSISTDNEPGTAILTLSAESTNRSVVGPAVDAAANELEQNPVSDLVRVSVLNPASEPRSLYAKRAVPIILGSVMLGLIAALFSAIAARALRRRIPGPELIRERFGIDTLGEIPAKNPFPTPENLFAPGWPSDALEAYQRLRANVEIMVPGPAVVAITSWSEGEGKTTVTSNLGWALAALGREVVIVDCDLRRPAIHWTMKDPLKAGAMQAGVAELANGAEIDAVLHETSQPDLRVIPAGKPRDHPAHVISAAMPRLLDELSGVTILIDTPPMFTAETTAIVSGADGVIIVVDARGHTPLEFETALGELRRPGAKLLGIVLNRSRAGSRGESGYRYYALPDLRGAQAAADRDQAPGEGPSRQRIRSSISSAVCLRAS